MTYEEWKEKRIVKNPEIKGGMTTFAGTRLTVYRVGGSLLQGESESVLLENYPYLTQEDLDYARRFVQEEGKI